MARRGDIENCKSLAVFCEECTKRFEPNEKSDRICLKCYAKKKKEVDRLIASIGDMN